jgi:hypothetical protein
MKTRKEIEDQIGFLEKEKKKMMNGNALSFSATALALVQGKILSLRWVLTKTRKP